MKVFSTPSEWGRSEVEWAANRREAACDGLEDFDLTPPKSKRGRKKHKPLTEQPAPPTTAEDMTQHAYELELE